MTTARVAGLAIDGVHRFSKQPVSSVRMVAGLGIEGDAHWGALVQHRSRVAVDPTQPNLRQIHLLQAELLDELAARGFAVAPGMLGENVTTRGVDLLGLATGTVLRIGADVALEVTGLRNPCAQIERFEAGLLAAVLERRPSGAIVRKAGVMAIVMAGGDVRTGDAIALSPPPPPHRPLAPV